MLPFLQMMFSSDDTPFSLTIASGNPSPNIRQLAVAAGWNQRAKLLVNVTAARVAGLVVPSASQASFPAGVEITIGAGTTIYGDAALSAGQPITVRNLGTLAANGGIGGNGGSMRFVIDGVTYNGSGGTFGFGALFNGTSVFPAQDGENGTRSYLEYPNSWVEGGKGGKGGDFGQWGSAGSAPTCSPDLVGHPNAVITPPQSGGPPGYAVSGNSNITWLATGTRLGRIQ